MRKKYQYHICDPFALYIPEESFVDANKLFRDFEAKSGKIFENKYIIKNDKIVGFNQDGNLVIKRLIPDNDNWIFYLRNELKDFNRIFISSVSEKIIDLIVKSKKTTEETTTNVYKKYPKKYFVTWTLKYKKMNIFLTAEFKNDKIEQSETKSDSIQIVPDLYLNSDMEVENFVNICDCLDNDDLVMVAYWGVVIWTFNTKNYKIELNYSWENENNTLDLKGNEIFNLFYETSKENFDEKNFDIKKFKKKSYFLPPSSYINMIHYNPAFSQPHLQPPEDLIEDIIKEDEETLLQKLLNGCIKQIEEDEEILNSLIFNIFSQSITEIFNDFVTKISLLCILKNAAQNFEIIIFQFLILQISVCNGEIRKLISNINSDDWEESTKPIITKIAKAIRDEKPESEFDKIQKMIEKVVEERDQKLALEAEKTKKIFENQASEAEKIKKIFENQASETKDIKEIFEKQALEAKEIKEIFEKQALETKEIKGIKEMFDKIMKKLENQSLEKHDN
ncbi:8257_t:CDS:2 [Gigaspora margarita]|uniref:8257_t:CDS:1 n=1 Tax=Gigaspora margarita TaxID=4874 RepID=A0ABN7VV06_GIGMA|nr:8257_t:CDS:2 [Gigaspora margarita]